MTLAWALIIIAGLFLLDRHHLLGKALMRAAMVAAIGVMGFAVLLTYQWAQPKVEAYQFARHHECFNLATGKTHSINGQCEWDEEVHERGTALPVTPKCEQGTLFNKVQIPNDGIQRYWQDGHWCQLTQTVDLLPTPTFGPTDSATGVSMDFSSFVPILPKVPKGVSTTVVYVPPLKARGLVDCWNSTNDKIVKCLIPMETKLDRCIISSADGVILGTHGWAVLKEECREKIDTKYHSILDQ